MQKQDQFILAHKSIEAKKYFVRNLPDLNPGKMIEELREEQYERHMKMMAAKSQDEFFKRIEFVVQEYSNSHNGLSESEAYRVAYWTLQTEEQFIWASVLALMEAHCKVLSGSTGTILD